MESARALLTWFALIHARLIVMRQGVAARS